MWNRIKSLSLMFCLLCLPLCLSPSESSATSPTMPQNQQVTISAEQYLTLKRTVAQLDTNLTTLKANSAQDKKDLETLKTQLEASRNALNQAQVSSSQASSSLMRLEQNLQTLTVQTESLQKKLETKERQNKTAWVIAGACLIAAISN